jgi:hypothetical protein
MTPCFPALFMPLAEHSAALVLAGEIFRRILFWLRVAGEIWSEFLVQFRSIHDSKKSS